MNRDTFTGDGRLVNAGYTFQHNAVNRDIHTWFYQHDVPHNHLFYRDFQFFTVSFNCGSFRSKVQKTGDGFAGFTFTAGFQEFAKGDKCKDSGAAFKIKVHMVFCNQSHISCAHTPAHAEDGEQTIDNGGC